MSQLGKQITKLIQSYGTSQGDILLRKVKLQCKSSPETMRDVAYYLTMELSKSRRFFNKVNAINIVNIFFNRSKVFRCEMSNSLREIIKSTYNTDNGLTIKKSELIIIRKLLVHLIGRWDEEYGDFYTELHGCARYFDERHNITISDDVLQYLQDDRLHREVMDRFQAVTNEMKYNFKTLSHTIVLFEKCDRLNSATKSHKAMLELREVETQRILKKNTNQKSNSVYRVSNSLRFLDSLIAQNSSVLEHLQPSAVLNESDDEIDWVSDSDDDEDEILPPLKKAKQNHHDVPSQALFEKIDDELVNRSIEEMKQHMTENIIPTLSSWQDKLSQSVGYFKLKDRYSKELQLSRKLLQMVSKTCLQLHKLLDKYEDS